MAKPSPTSTTPELAPAREHVAPVREEDVVVLSVAKRLQILLDARDGLAKAQESLLKRLENLSATVACSQDALQTFLLLKQIADGAKETVEALKQRFIDHRAHKGVFEHGEFAITIKAFDKTTVSWKDVATEHAREVALAAGQEFHEDKYNEAIAKKYGKIGTQTNVTVVQSE